MRCDAMRIVYRCLAPAAAVAAAAAAAVDVVAVEPLHQPGEGLLMELS